LKSPSVRTGMPVLVVMSLQGAAGVCGRGDAIGAGRQALGGRWE
jgi:hypothetical protein